MLPRGVEKEKGIAIVLIRKKRKKKTLIAPLWGLGGGGRGLIEEHAYGTVSFVVCHILHLPHRLQRSMFRLN